MDAQELRERAKRYRQTAALLTDAEISEALLDLATKAVRWPCGGWGARTANLHAPGGFP